MKYLVEDCHCDPFQPQGSKQKVPIQSAVFGNQLDTVKYLTTRPEFKHTDCDPSLIHLAVGEKCLKMITYLIQILKCDFNRKYRQEFPIHLASFYGGLDIVRYFITTLKCDPTTKGRFDSQPIHYAAMGGQLNIVKYFVEELSISETVANDKGETSLHIASRYGHFKLAKYLTAKSCNPSSVCESIGSSLHAAAYGGHEKIVCYFVKRMKCAPDCRTGADHCTPLHVAAASGPIYCT